MKKWKKRTAIVLIMLFCALPAYESMTMVSVAAKGISETITAKSSGWVTPDGTIYQEPSGGAGEQTIISPDSDSSDKPGLVEKLFGAFIAALAKGLNALEELAHMGITDIIYGRVCGHGDNGVSWFTFELVEDNPFGYIAALLYGAFRGVTLVIAVCVLATKLAAAAVNQSATARDNLKSAFSNFVLVMLLLYLMPYMLDLALYIRDHILYAVGKVCNTNFGTMDLFDAFSAVYNRSGKFIDALIMFGVVILALYFAFTYISVAMGMTVLFIMFPFICVTSSFDKDAIVRWCKEALGYMLVPCIDAALMMIPLAMGAIGSAGILQLLACMMIIPARQSIRALLGLNSNSGLDRSGVMSAMGALMLGRTAMHGIGSIAGKIKNSADSRKQGKYEQAMADAENEELQDAADQMNGQNGYGGSRVTRLPMDFGKGRKQKQKALDEANSFLNAADELEKKDGGTGALADEIEENRTAAAEIISENGLENYLGQKGGNNTAERNRIEGAQRLAAAQGVSVGDIDSSLTDKYADNINYLRNSNKGLGADNKRLALNNEKINVGMASGQIDKAQGRLDIARNKQQIAENNEKIAMNDAKIEELQEEQAAVENIGTQMSRGKGFGRGSVAGMSAGNSAWDKQNELERRFANAKNFDSGAFSTLTHQQKADLYRKRAGNELRSAIGATVVGGIGATLGFGASTFFSPMTKGVMMSAGASAGGLAGMGIMAIPNAIIGNNVPAGSGSVNLTGVAGNIPEAAAAVSLAAPMPSAVQSAYALSMPKYIGSPVSPAVSAVRIPRQDVLAGRAVMMQQVSKLQEQGMSADAFRAGIVSQLVQSRNMTRIDAERVSRIVMDQQRDKLKPFFGDF